MRKTLTNTELTLQKLAAHITGPAGPTLARTLLYQMGNEIGHTAWCHSKDKIQSPADLTKVFDRVLNPRGWGTCLSLEMTGRDGKTMYECVLKETPSSYDRVANEPICHLIRGVIVGWLEAYLQEEAKSSTETNCASKGNEYCVFEVEFNEPLKAAQGHDS